MNSKTSSHKIRTIITNDFKRYWVISIAAFILHFVSTNAVVLINYASLKANDGSEYSMATDLCNFSYFGDLYIAALLPVIAALSVFRYLNTVASVTAVHSLPVSRKHLLIGHAAAGYALCAVPVILNKAITLLLLIPIKNATPVGTIITLIAMLVTILFMYAISVLSCMLCGTTLMAAVGAVGLNILLPSFGLFLAYYGATFLKGYSPTSLMQHMMNSAAIAKLASFNAPFSSVILSMIIYVIISALILALCFILYRKRKLENATEPLAFGFMVPIVCGLLTFFLSSYTAAMFVPNIPFTIGVTVFGIIIYLFSRMFALKTTRIFNKETAKTFGIYALIMAVLISCYAIDITGYEEKTADLDKTVSVSTTLISNLTGDERIIFGEEPLELTEPENIKAVMKFHELLMAEADSSDSPVLFDAFNNTSTFEFTYSNGRVFSRKYSNVTADYLESDAARTIYESKEFKEYYSISHSNLDPKTLEAHLMPIWDASNAENINNGLAPSLMEALDKDFSVRTFDQALTSPRIGSVEFSTYDGAYRQVSIYASDKNTIKWLKDNDLYSSIDGNCQRITKVEVSVEDDDYKKISTDAEGLTLNQYIKKYGNPRDDYNEVYASVLLSLKDTETGTESDFMILYDKAHYPDF